MITSATKNIVKTEEALHREFLIVSESIKPEVSLFSPKFDEKLELEVKV